MIDYVVQVYIRFGESEFARYEFKHLSTWQFRVNEFLWIPPLEDGYQVKEVMVSADCVRLDLGHQVIGQTPRIYKDEFEKWIKAIESSLGVIR